ncbi:MAG: ABC transporter ATP-binding protein [Planctomycetota bacterium]
MAEVVLDDVTKVYAGDVEAVKGASIVIADKEFVVLVGPSGCGKSTTLRMVAGLEEITKGTISIGGTVVNDVAPKDRDIAMVFQNYALYPHMTVYKNMAFGLKLRKFPKDEIDARVKDAARILGITELLDRRPKELSGGQRQRVAVGRAIVRQPKAFLFDEPLSNLDAKLRVEMRAELKKLHQRLQTTMIYVTHDQVEAMTLGDRIVIMKDGVIDQVDEPLSIYRQPVNKFVAGFIGTPPMNFLEGALERDGGGLVFADGDMRIALGARLSGVLEGRDGAQVSLGVRPEDIHMEAEKYPEGARFRCKVEVVEPLGDEMIVYLATAKQSMVGKMRAEHLKVGEEMEVGVDLDKVHVLHGETEENLTRDGSAADGGARAPATAGLQAGEDA